MITISNYLVPHAALAMQASKCFITLVDDSVSVDVKHAALDAYLKASVGFALETGGNVAGGLRLGWEHLSRSIPNGDVRLQEKFATAIKATCAFRKAEKRAHREAIAARLRRLPSGTPIIIKTRRGNELVSFLQMNRTRFEFTRPGDAERDVWTAPVECFIGLADGTTHGDMPA